MTKNNEERNIKRFNELNKTIKQLLLLSLPNKDNISIVNLRQIIKGANNITPYGDNKYICISPKTLRGYSVVIEDITPEKEQKYFIEFTDKNYRNIRGYKNLYMSIVEDKLKFIFIKGSLRLSSNEEKECKVVKITII